MQEIRDLVRAAAEKARQETSEEPEPKFTGTVEFPVDCAVGRGLEGAIATDTKIGYVNGTKGWLVYRGYEIFDLAQFSTFEETSYLLLYGKLPTSSELAAFDKKLKEYRNVPASVIQVLKEMPIKDTHPMSALRTAVSFLGNLDGTADDTSVEAEREVSIKLIALFPALAGAVARLRKGQEPVQPKGDHTLAQTLLYTMTGKEPDELNARLMDINLILHADHGMNASTFTTMVCNSSLSDMYGSVVAGIASLKGPLHGGANEQVLYTLEEIGSEGNVEPWYEKARAEKRKIMGMGHRVYKAYDPRARILGPLAAALCEDHPEVAEIYKIAVKLEKIVTDQLGAEKKIFPNVDYYSGIVYRAMGIETAMFTPIFAVSRVSGWTARALEYLETNRIFRPRAIYTGPVAAEYVPIEKR
ncbi:MAG: citrate synthase/methylcitrate synthase [Candidatus Eisenbacteria bacterium]|uniref:Citrate synthase n=1 Tax=Eiseniibacteriota bacterium TaxID=2212470 RepID=A0A956NG23_UNCEI|nr:citrate synthase/methylcitrate synthase [Candidatus Eisenbacteria bacterium]MCB9463434.1 citrate synthase/methylcitrate synthase [Candidatus Eisenbacteria bacterium]